MFSSPQSPPRFRLDAWASDYGATVDTEDGDEDDARGFEIDAFVEVSAWDGPITCTPVARPERIIFVDGVQRTEVWGRIEVDGAVVDAALGSVAVGAAISYAGRAEVAFDEPGRVHRVYAVGGAVSVDSLNVRSGSHEMRFEPAISEKHGRTGVSLALGNRRAMLERQFAEKLVDEDSLVVLDGRLSFEPGPAHQVVGMAKTIHRNYLQGMPECAIVPMLGACERTPVFRIHYGDTTRYSWYLRLPFTRTIHHSLAGIVRLETPEIGEAAAIRLANLTSYHLPDFASQPQHDPRAPQNLVPIGALEKRLRHEMGDATWLRRTIEDYLYDEYQKETAL
jgi:hypothetical protein